MGGLGWRRICSDPFSGYRRLWAKMNFCPGWHIVNLVSLVFLG